MIYFILDRDAALVKIGHAIDPWRRLSQIQVSNPSKLEIVAVQGGGPVEEAQLHDRFAASHFRGEWFRFDPELQAFVAELGEPARPLRANDTTKFWGMQQIEVAQATGISQGMLSRLQRGLRRASPEAAITLQRLTGVSAIRLVFGDLAEEAF